MKITIELDINEISDFAEITKNKLGMASRANLDRYAKEVIVDHINAILETKSNHVFTDNKPWKPPETRSSSGW